MHSSLSGRQDRVVGGCPQHLHLLCGLRNFEGEVIYRKEDPRNETGGLQAPEEVGTIRGRGGLSTGSPESPFNYDGLWLPIKWLKKIIRLWIQFATITNYSLARMTARAASCTPGDSGSISQSRRVSSEWGLQGHQARQNRIFGSPGTGHRREFRPIRKVLSELEGQSRDR